MENGSDQDIARTFLNSFSEAAANERIVSARFAVLDEATKILPEIAHLTRSLGSAENDPFPSAVGLLTELANELVAGITLLLRNSVSYSAAALLRQLVEIEYLMFLGLGDAEDLSKWYTSNSDDLRRLFTQKKMREKSEGLFSDKEYWLHCEVGGHPHPKSKIALSSYTGKFNPAWTLLPDTVQHFRRLWISLSLVLQRIGISKAVIDKNASSLIDALEEWYEVENPLILSMDGIDLDAYNMKTSTAIN